MKDEFNLKKMEDDLNFSANGRWPQYFSNGRRPIFFLEIEDDINILENGRQPQSFGKWKTT